MKLLTKHSLDLRIFGITLSFFNKSLANYFFPVEFDTLSNFVNHLYHKLLTTNKLCKIFKKKIGKITKSKVYIVGFQYICIHEITYFNG